MKEIKSRKEVFELVTLFYDKVKEDNLLGPVFFHMIKTDELWAHHMEKLTDFWQVSLLGQGKYEGSPMALHLWVDMQINFKMESVHFDRWLYLWKQTLEENFKGEVAEFALKRAHAMGRQILKKVMSSKYKA